MLPILGRGRDEATERVGADVAATRARAARAGAKGAGIVGGSIGLTLLAAWLTGFLGWVPGSVMPSARPGFEHSVAAPGALAGPSTSAVSSYPPPSITYTPVAASQIVSSGPSTGLSQTITVVVR